MTGVMGCYEQPAITAITPVMAAPITLTGVKAGEPPAGLRRGLKTKKPPSKWVMAGVSLLMSVVE